MTHRHILLSVLMLAVQTASAQTPSATPKGSPETAQTASTAAPAPTPAPDPLRTNTIRWVVRGGSSNYAYEVFRAESEAGPFVKANRDFISGHINSRRQTVAAYQYVDADIDPAQDYWYYVESINLMGVRERLTPIRKAPAKQPAASVSVTPTPTPH